MFWGIVPGHVNSHFMRFPALIFAPLAMSRTGTWRFMRAGALNLCDIGNNMKNSSIILSNLLASLLLLLISIPCLAGSFSDAFIDPSDGYLDMSNWLLNKKGLLPVPVIITEPAIGYGGGLAVVYFHDKLGAQKGIPPSVSALVGAATENGTWFVGGGHMGIWAQDNIRYTGGLGAGVVKMDYYGLSGFDGRGKNQGVHFETEAQFMMHELQFRLWDSNFFAGIGYTLIDTKNAFKLSPETPTPGLPGVKFDSRSAALSLMLNYDSRDNMFTPSKGIAAEIKVMSFNDAWGSDQNFEKYSALFTYYTKLNKKLVLGLRGSAKSIDGDAPFYAYPYIDMRGIKAMQYQGDKTLLGEAELRWSFTPRWALVGFGGAGKAYNEGKKGNTDIIYSKGVGMRYLIASKLGLQMGIDIAQGPDDTAFYIQFGSSWALK